MKSLLRKLKQKKFNLLLMKIIHIVYLAPCPGTRSGLFKRKEMAKRGVGGWEEGVVTPPPRKMFDTDTELKDGRIKRNECYSGWDERASEG